MSEPPKKEIVLCPYCRRPAWHERDGWYCYNPVCTGNPEFTREKFIEQSTGTRATPPQPESTLEKIKRMLTTDSKKNL